MCQLVIHCSELLTRLQCLYALHGEKSTPGFVGSSVGAALAVVSFLYSSPELSFLSCRLALLPTVITCSAATHRNCSLLSGQCAVCTRCQKGRKLLL